ncbi:MAG: SAM-dependent methyltransferase [Saprospiraceae bacterium]|nr:SAM-dependent methyltransferase [Saprospiraceae bacterium]
MTGTLYVLPNVLSPENQATISEEARTIIAELRHFAVENVKVTRRYIRALGIKTDFDACSFYEIWHKRSDEELLEAYGGALRALESGEDVGILSDAGAAGIADPGSALVALAHRHQFPVRPISGPSSIFLALMASGFNGQKFQFHGYLPVEARSKQAAIKALETETRVHNTTSIFMETPYRNQQMLEALVNHLQPNTLLCVAADLTGPAEFVKTQPIKSWKNAKINLHKKPCIFLIGVI